MAILQFKKYEYPIVELDERLTTSSQLLQRAGWDAFFKSKGFVENYPDVILHNHDAEELYDEILDELSSVMSLPEHMRPYVEVRTRPYLGEQDEPFVLCWIVLHHFGTLHSDLRNTIAYLLSSGAMGWVRDQYTVDGEAPFLLALDPPNMVDSGRYWQDIMLEYRPADLLEDEFGDEVVYSAVCSLCRSREEMEEYTEKKNLKAKYRYFRNKFVDVYCAYREMNVIERMMLEEQVLDNFGRELLEILENNALCSELRLKVQLMRKSLNRRKKPDMDWVKLEVNRQVDPLREDIERKKKELEASNKALPTPPKVLSQIKEKYRIVMSVVHPDLLPHAQDGAQEIYRDAQEGFEQLDLQMLVSACERALEMESSLMLDVEELSGEEAREGVQHFRTLIGQYEEMIESTNRQYPFTYRETLASPENIVNNVLNLHYQADSFIEEIIYYNQQYEILLHECEEFRTDDQSLTDDL